MELCNVCLERRARNFDVRFKHARTGALHEFAQLCDECDRFISGRMLVGDWGRETEVSAATLIERELHAEGR